MRVAVHWLEPRNAPGANRSAGAGAGNSFLDSVRVARCRYDSDVNIITPNPRI